MNHDDLREFAALMREIGIRRVRREILNDEPVWLELELAPDAPPVADEAPTQADEHDRCAECSKLLDTRDGNDLLIAGEASVPRFRMMPDYCDRCGPELRYGAAR